MRNDTRLGNDTDRAIKNLRIFESDSDSDSDQESIKREDKKKKLRSGKTLKLSSRVVRQEKWPHCFLPCSQKGGADKKYDDLTVEDFVSGFAVILTELSPSSSTQLQEFQARTAHLARLMELATIYHWKAVLNFHSRCLLQIERGQLNWGDSFDHLESIALSAHLKVKTGVGSAGKKANLRPFYCLSYQNGGCKEEDSHWGSFKGESKFMQHICATCLRAGNNEKHSESSEQCPFRLK